MTYLVIEARRIAEAIGRFKIFKKASYRVTTNIMGASRSHARGITRRGFFVSGVPINGQSTLLSGLAKTKARAISSILMVAEPFADLMKNVFVNLGIDSQKSRAPLPYKLVVEIEWEDDVDQIIWQKQALHQPILKYQSFCGVRFHKQ